MKTTNQLVNQLVNNVFIIVFTICILYVFSYFAVYINDVINESNEIKTKPISYPEEIQIAKAGDTLIVTSVSDSIYIGFKH
jgi:hypothetical protein